MQKTKEGKRMWYSNQPRARVSAQEAGIQERGWSREKSGKQDNQGFFPTGWIGTRGSGRGG